jgi:ABC-type transport system substrate-binding protein
VFPASAPSLASKGGCSTRHGFDSVRSMNRKGIGMKPRMTSRRDVVKRGSALGMAAGIAGTTDVLASVSDQAQPRVATFQDGSSGGTLRLVDATEPNSLDPPIGTGPFSHIVLSMFEPLLRMDAEGNAHPNLATEWSVGEDELTWTISLKPDVKFHDGTDFSSESVKYAFERLQDPEFAAGRAAIFNVIEEVTAVEPLVATIKTTRPFPDLPFLLTDQSSSIVSEAASEAAGYEDFGLKPVGTGPFQFVEWVPNDHVTVKRFDGYHGTPAKIDELILRVVPEASSREAMLSAGEADIVVSPPSESLPTLQENPDFEVIVYDSLSQVTSEMRQTQPPFSVKEVRQAMNYAIDSQAIIDTIMNGLGRLCDSPAPPNVWGAVQLEPYPYDPERARELLAQGGYPDGFQGNLFYVSGRWAGDDQVTQALQAYWAQVGVQIELNRIDMGSLGDYLSDDPDNRAGWTTQQIRSSTYLDYHLYRLFHSESTLAEGAQRSGYQNEEVDQLLNEGRSTFVEEDRLAAYEEAQRLIWDDAPFIWVFILSNTVVHRVGVTGLEILPNADMFFTNVTLP